MTKTALLAGATGLVGGILLKRLLDAPAYDRVIAVTRRSLGFSHPKLTEIVTDFDTLELALAKSAVHADDAFCALGTTIRKAGSQPAFHRVDFDYVVNFARAAKASGATRFLLVSAIGASAGSTIFYSRVKGEAEEAASALGFEATHIFRPGLILGDRAERRPAEAAMMAAMPLLNPLLIGPTKIYRGIPADTIAAAMIAAAATSTTGRIIHTYASMSALTTDREH
ncbi:NAD(P)H-binding protein [Parvibaculum sedimenti]|uniref:NAD(P)H-binding protein n=1 Tax=Parvibaculum sedimenti TaxID=2608632 RepID=A0A6N6VQ37_9HYPH|nr:NAD(P)H-binding protein [Parvibaculum sedimenti]KAB7741644.1 NAD(P)H-binding protein [Parvibaculum sedimenti]